MIASGGVSVAGRIARERNNTVGRVVVAGGVVKERIIPRCRVAEAACNAEKRILTLGGVEIRITAVRRWINCPDSRRKREAGEAGYDEKAGEFCS